MERRLGRGLGSLLGGVSPQGPNPDDIHELHLEEIQPNPFQPRKAFDSVHLEELRTSIQNHGILQPICCRLVGDRYEIISGERRWRAARMAGLTRIPVVVRGDVDDDEMLELALVENIQRRDLDAIEKARGYSDMMTRLNLTQERVAEKVGMKRATVANHVRLLDLPTKAQEAVVAGLISMGHARALLGLPNERAILTMLANIVRGELSVRDVEREVRGGASATASPAAGKPDKVLQPRAPWMGEIERRIREGLGAKTTIDNRDGYRGKIVLHYHDREELDRLCDALAPRDEL
jgi:ParB family chromosome partitioning protein